MAKIKENKTQLRDCPLCKAKKVIKIIKGNSGFEILPAREGTLGNTRPSFESDQYDYSHAEVCPELDRVIHKKELLMYFDNTNILILSSLESFSDINKVIKKAGFTLKSTSLVLEKKKDKTILSKQRYGLETYPFWENIMFLQNGSGERFLETKYEDNRRGYSQILHRILCGEVLTRKGIPVQFVAIDGKLDFRNL